MPNFQSAVNRIVDITTKLDAHISVYGAAPSPDLNPLFCELTAFVVEVSDPKEQRDILNALENNHSEALSKLRVLCSRGEAALEAKAVSYFVAQALEGASTQLGEDKIEVLENILAPIYPYKWSRTQARLQKELVFGGDKLTDQYLLIYGYTGLALSHLSWLWTAELYDASFKILAVDPDPERAILGRNFIKALEEKGFIQTGQMTLIDAPPNSALSDLVDTYKISTACLNGVDEGAGKHSAFKALQKTTISKICMTYPDGLVRLLYEPFDLGLALSSTYHTQSCLLPLHCAQPALPVDKIMRPQEEESLWLSSYVFKRIE